MNTIREDEMGRLLKGIFEPVVASSEFKERLLKRLTQEVSRGVKEVLAYNRTDARTPCPHRDGCGAGPSCHQGQGCEIAPYQLSIEGPRLSLSI